MKKKTKKQIKKEEKRLRNKLDKEWREKIKKEFDNKCMLCKEKKKRLDCHHLIPREIKAFRHEQVNGVLLCPLHHKFSLDISPHRNPLIFFERYKKEYPNRYKKLLKLLNNYKLLKGGKK